MLIHTYIYVYTHICIYIYIHIHIYIYIYICACLCIYFCIGSDITMKVCDTRLAFTPRQRAQIKRKPDWLFVYIYICIHIYICMCMCTHIYIYIWGCTSNSQTSVCVLFVIYQNDHAGSHRWLSTPPSRAIGTAASTENMSSTPSTPCLIAHTSSLAFALSAW